MDNMKFYNMGRTVPDNAKKPITAGRLSGMTDINPMWRIKRLTEMFGACGVGWWYEITDKQILVDEITKQKAAFVDILLYYKDPESGKDSHGIPGTGGSSFVAQERKGAYLSDECFKMALTDAISVAAKALGIGADVYFDKDRTKYSGNPENTDKQDPPKPEFVCEECGNEIVPYPDANGKIVGVKKHCDGSMAAFNRILCIDCIQKKANGG